MIGIYNKVLNSNNICITGEVGMLEPEQFEKLCEGLLNVIKEDIEGEVVEFGSYIGEAAKMLMRTIKFSESNKQLYCYDSFDGLPSLSKWEENTGWKSGSLKTTMDVLIKNFESNDLPLPIIHKDFFCNIPESKIPEKISFAFLDGDFYTSILDSLEKIYDKVTDGGYIFFHDYKRPDLPGVEAAIKDFLISRNLDYTVIEVSEGLGLMIKHRHIKNQEEIFKIDKISKVTNSDTTLVTGFWGFSKNENDLEKYIQNFKKLLSVQQNLMIYIPKNFEYLVWENRHKKNTLIQHYDLDNIKKIYEPFWEKTQQVKKNIQLKSVETNYKFENEISFSKMFIFNDSTIWNPFDSKYFYWVDFDLTSNIFYETDFFNINNDSYLFSSSNVINEKTKEDYNLNGFSFNNMCNFINNDIKISYRCDLFGGKKEYINSLNGEYYSTLNEILNKNYLGDINNLLTIIFNRKNNEIIKQKPDDCLFDLIKKYDCDKVSSGYDYIYKNLFTKIKDNKLNYLEIGLGTLLDVKSSHIGTLSKRPNFKPSSILKVWKEYFRNSNIYGIDISEDCMISEDRIKTFLLDSTDNQKCNDILSDLKFDIILDDGNHTADSQFITFENFFHRLNDGGYYIIEDIGGGGDNVSFYEKYKNKLKEMIDIHEYFLDWNILCIRKNNSGRGCHFGNFLSDVEFIYSGEGFESFINERAPNKNIDHSFYRNWIINPIDTVIVDENKQINELTKKVLGLEEKYNNLKDELNQTKNLSTKKQNFEINKNLTIVTGLWNLNRPGRDFSHYIEHFKNFLDIPQNLFIYIPAEYEYLVWEKRSKENTYVKIYELDDVKNLYSPFWDKTNEIRKSDNWLNQAGWLSGSPQAVLEYYNPIVQSKMFMLNDATIWNPFNTEYFFWLDAGITNTVPHGHFVENNILDKLPEYGNPFLFLSYPYEANAEIHGFTFDEMNRIAGKKVEYVCRGGLFGGHKQQINEANSTYYSVLQTTLNRGFMGTEESIFTLMSYSEPHIYKRFELDGNGLIVKFTQAVIDNKVDIVAPKITELKSYIKYTDRDVDNVKTNLYILTFNFPEQVLHTIESMKKTPEWLTKPRLVLLDNSTIEDSKIKNREIAEQYNFEYIDLGGNRGICGGRQAAAEHFNDSDADFMFFFEDDMTSNPPEFEGQFCRNGFRKYIPNLYNLVHRIMLKEDYDFLKLSFTEVYFDNDKQCSWYNVPQHIRTRDWPYYDKLPISGLDPNVPLTNFKNIKNMDGLTYIDGEIYYANWPMIVSKNGNYKMFIETKWAHPFEQTWMSYIYQLTKENKINPAILLASPIWHDRIKHYQPNERREN